MIYGREVLMVAAARWLARHHLLYVWRKPTWIHLISLPDFLTCVVKAATLESCGGIYNLGDDHPMTLQEFLIGMVSYTADTSRMKVELLPQLEHPTLQDGLRLL